MTPRRLLLIVRAFCWPREGRATSTSTTRTATRAGDVFVHVRKERAPGDLLLEDMSYLGLVSNDGMLRAYEMLDGKGR